MRNHFHNFFRKDNVSRPWFTNIKLKKLSAAENQLLEAPFSLEEIWDVVKFFDGNKAPGPDGFSMDFFKKFWNLVKEDLLNFFNDFYLTGRLVKGLNSTFIALIPKGGQQEEISDYRPISLIGSVYKLLSKVLSVRLSMVLPRLLSQNQFAFTTGRQIADCSLIANEIVHTMSSRPEGGLLFKIDFAKAYDNVEWDFMLEILQEMGFGEKWIRWMQVCVSTTTLAVLVNGSPSDFFNIHKGLRQGDPLSPLLFNIVANGMSCMLNQLLEGDSPCGVELAPGLRLNHLQFADDSLLFSDCDENQFQILAMAVEAFLYSSGLKVNFSKSAVYGVNAPLSLVQEAASWWNFKIGSLPFMYLGSPLGGNPRRLSFWNPVLEKMTAKLGVWSSRFLSLSGRLVLVKSVLNAIPLYYMALYRAPKGVIQRFEKIMRRFLWGGSAGENKIMWVAWEELCKGTRFGGLGVGFLEWKNKAMLLKWVWRFGREREALWRVVVCKKYGLPMELISFNLDPSDLKKLSKPMADVYGVWREGGLVGSIFRDGIACQVGRGGGVFFWLDHWVGGAPLCLTFPRVFALAVHKRATVMEYGVVAGHQWVWNIAFSRDFLGWERQQYLDLQSLLQSLVPKQGERADRDNLIWKHDNMGLYNVKSLCAVVEARWFTEDGWSVPKLLSPILPSKIALFLWQVQKNRIATKDNLEHRGVVLEDGTTCVFCLSAPETVDHLFLHCPKIWGLWAEVLNREDRCWSVQNSIMGCLGEWSFLRKSTSKVLWELIPYAICWVVWMARNDIIFNNKLFDAEALWESHMFQLFTWIKAWWKECPYGFDQFERGYTKIVLDRKASSRPILPWKPPHGMNLKFNVDGSFQAGKAGIGGILRNKEGKVLGKFSRRVEARRADEAEVLAILYALLFCQQFMVRTIEIESDSVLAVGWVCGEKSRPWNLTNELNMIDYLFPLVACTGVSHILREGNAEADELAKEGCFREEQLWSFEGQG